MATVIGRILDLYDHKQGQAKAYRDQNDIPKWAVDGVQKSFDAGIIQGYPDGKFKPDEKVTRDQMAAIISRLMDYLIKQI
nr:S-layer homology domain-containing protein [Cohnella cholangitidis]